MRRQIAFIAATILLSALSSFAQGVLPDSFAGWNGSARSGFAPMQTSGLNNDASAANEYGFVAGERRIYSQGADSLEVTLYRMKDPSGAYGEYSYLRTSDMPHASLADHSAMSSDHALALVGNLVLEIRGRDLSKFETDLKTLSAVAGSHAEEGLLPSLRDHMPQTGMVERSDHYILGPVVLNQFVAVSSGDWLGFSQGAEAETARYRLNGKEVTLLIADFPTPQTAQKKLAEFQQKFNGTGSGADPSSPHLFAKRSVTLLAIVVGAKTQNEADILLKQVRSGTELMWNEPSFELTDPSVGTLIVGTIIGTGIICAFALISGLAFGGVRLIVKRAFPDKVFDRSSHLQILQMGLSSKPINAEDFYGIGGNSSK
jgi:hypothetical protein